MGLGASPPVPWTAPPTVPPSWPGAWRDKSRLRSAGGLLAAAAVLHLISVPLGLVVLQAEVSQEVGRSVSWGEIFDELYRSGNGFIAALIVAGVVAQIAFAVVAGSGSFLLYRGRAGVAVAMMAAGILAIIVSIVVLGGILGLLGGILSVGGGIKAYTPARPFVSLPPPPPPPSIPP